MIFREFGIFYYLEYILLQPNVIHTFRLLGISDHLFIVQLYQKENPFKYLLSTVTRLLVRNIQKMPQDYGLFKRLPVGKGFNIIEAV